MRRAAHVQAAIRRHQGKGVQRKAEEGSAGRAMASHVRAAIQGPSQPTLQLSAYGVGDFGFSGLKKPTGYGSVSLTATICGVDVGDAWSRRTTYSIGTEHAEDAVVDYVETIEGMWANRIVHQGMIKVWPEPTDTEKSVLQALATGTKTLTITGLTASPCSTTLGTCTKSDLDGCTERLVGLARRGWTVSIQADHYYQPKKVSQAKQKSKQACQAMRNAGITVVVSNP